MPDTDPSIDGDTPGDLTSRRPYHSPLRDSRTEQTRERIVAEAYRQLQVIPVHELSYAEIAKALRIATRTVYRHFPERDELVTAVSGRHIARLLEPTGDLPRTLPEAAAMLRRAFALLEQEPGTYRLFFHLPVRSQGNVRRLVDLVWSDVLAQLPETDRPAAAGLFELLMSPYAYDVLHENFGLSAADTTRVCLVALDIIAQGLARDPTALSRDRGEPARFTAPAPTR